MTKVYFRNNCIVFEELLASIGIGRSQMQFYLVTHVA